jgi:exopolyphosphatase/guanosine-5'-triphosphate,3'-diphosphate pyrophosphatase
MIAPRRLAVIDLGSNTFHLLIVEITASKSWNVLLKDRRYVKLASGGIAQIEENKIDRAVSVMEEFAAQVAEYEVDKTIAIGTAALREAENGQEVVDRIQKGSGINVLLIDGMREATYIYRGIASCIPTLDLPGLIVDIGGGSVEFILYHNQKIQFVGSYTIGVGVLFERFHTSDPFPEENITALELFLDESLVDLHDVLSEVGPYYLVGASGSFEVIQDMLPKLEFGDHWSRLDTEPLEAYLNEVIGLEFIKRKMRDEIPQERLDYIVVAYLLIRYIIRHYPPNGLYYSDYALKEGILAEAIDILLD